jgi:uncharacterized RDD family membrane protein YckC
VVDAERREATRALGRRGLRLLIDGLLVSTAALVAGLLLWFAAALVIGVDAAVVIGVAGFGAVAFLGPIANDVWMPCKSRAGASVGMRIAGIRVVMLDGSRPPLRAFAIRYALWVVDGMLWGIVGLVVVLRTPYRQRVGDLVAGTVVVRKDSVDQPVLPGPDRDLGAVPEAEFALNAGQV